MRYNMSNSKTNQEVLLFTRMIIDLKKHNEVLMNVIKNLWRDSRPNDLGAQNEIDNLARQVLSNNISIEEYEKFLKGNKL